MPRRPRPAHRISPGQVRKYNHRALSLPAKAKIVPKAQLREPKSETSTRVAHEEESSFSEGFEEGSREDDKPGTRNALKRRRDEDVDVDEDEDGEMNAESDIDADTDTPRAVQWLDDEDILPGRFWEDILKHKVPDEEMLEANLKDLPLGALLRARRAFTQAEADSASDSDATGGSDSGLEAERTIEVVRDKGKEKVEWSLKPRKDIPRRANKNAPIEVTSKRPVTRKRTVVEVPKIVPRDPRFLATAGEFSAEKFSKSYSFLAEKHKLELATLRETLKQARKLLASSPRDLRSERDDEVYRIEQAIKRAESMVNKDRLDQVQRDALGKAKKEEEAKRQQGKGKWFLKKADRQQLVIKARYEALAKEGGTRAVKKAILKKQKKMSQSEKRSRPDKRQRTVGITENQ